MAAQVRGITVDTGEGASMKIGEVAKRTGLSLRTLRHYDEIGLVRPSSRTDAGYRLYTEDDFARLMVIRRMKPLGYTLDDMHQVVDLLRAGSAADREKWVELLNEASTRRSDLAHKVQMADEFIDLLRARSR